MSAFRSLSSVLYPRPKAIEHAAEAPSSDSSGAPAHSESASGNARRDPAERVAEAPVEDATGSR